MFEDTLAQIGFSKSEAKVYLELLKIGAQPVSTIAKRVGLNRTTTYSILCSLEKKGLTGSFLNVKTKFFRANDPNCLIGYLDRKCRTFDYYREEMLSMVTKFRSLSDAFTVKRPIVSYFEGMEGAKTLMYDSLKGVQDEFLAYLCLDKWLEYGMKDFLLEFKNSRVHDKNKKLRAIVPDTPAVREFFANNYDLGDGMTKVMFVKDFTNFLAFDNGMNIYGEKVAIVQLDKGAEYGVLIESREIADMQRAIFEMAWRAQSE